MYIYNIAYLISCIKWLSCKNSLTLQCVLPIKKSSWCVCSATPMFLIMLSPLPNNFGHYILHYCSVKFCSDLKLATKWGSDMDESVERANQVTESSISPVSGYDLYCLQICIAAYYLTTYFFLLPDLYCRDPFIIFPNLQTNYS